MSEVISKKSGGTFLVQETDITTFYSPELISEETSMMAEAGETFFANEIAPYAEELEKVEGISKSPALLKKCGDLGFLGLEVSEKYEGMNLPFKDVLHFVVAMSQGYSFCGAVGVQTSIGIAPVFLYGSEYLKEKYLAKMVSGELLSAFALTEPNAGSDANAGKTKATINENGDYVINGQKAWISNAGIADMFIVFAKIESDKNLSAFVVEKDFGGVTIGPEEQKMGLSGWSTCQVFFENTVIPKEQLLGERDKGLKIGLNTLNTGRIKLGASCVGIGKKALQESVNYANQRVQFGKSISNFGAIKDKMARMGAYIFANESMVFRLANDIDLLREELSGNGVDFSTAKIDSLKEFSIESAIVKVYGSEAQDFIVDQGVQIYGGMGFSTESTVANLYKAARISRIYEGTNEINRLVIIKEFIKKGMKGTLDLFSVFSEVSSELEMPAVPYTGNTIAQYEQFVKNLKSLAVLVSGVCLQKFMTQLEEEQEISMHISDLLIQLYAIESTVLRVKKLSEENMLEESLHINLLEAIAFDVYTKVSNTMNELVASLNTKEEGEMLVSAKEKFVRIPHANIKDVRRKIAAFIIDKGTI